MMSLFGRMRVVGVGLLAATFVAGALAGAAVDRVLSADEPDRVERDHDDDRRRSYVIDRVDMSEEQRGAIDAILEERSERMRAVWSEVEPRMDAITDSARVDIMEILTPEQRAEYERKLADRRRPDRDRRR
jgi:Spy/CpxP family protein refolding chaperone